MHIHWLIKKFLNLGTLSKKSGSLLNHNLWFTCGEYNWAIDYDNWMGLDWSRLVMLAFRHPLLHSGQAGLRGTNCPQISEVAGTIPGNDGLLHLINCNEQTVKLLQVIIIRRDGPLCG